MPGGASRPLDPASKAQHWQWSQLQGPARPSSFAGSRYRSRRASADRSHQQHARVMDCSPALTLPRRHKHECNAARAPRSADTRALQRGLTRQGSAQGGVVSWGSTTAPWTPAAPTHLDPPIPWCVSNVRTVADHRRSRWWSSWRYITGIEPARKGGRSAVVAGDAAVRRGPEARLRRAAARAAAWAHQVVSAGDHAGKGGTRSPSELSAAKGLLCVFALGCST